LPAYEPFITADESVGYFLASLSGLGPGQNTVVDGSGDPEKAVWLLRLTNLAWLGRKAVATVQ
jgi:hypothetical protein